jgi:hypothetical protein
MWPWIAGAAALGGLTWWLWPEDKAKSSVQHLVPKVDEHLLPITPQHKPVLLTHLKTEGKAVEAAKALYRSLRAGNAPAVLVAAFQRATDTDPASRELIGPIPITGIYDPRTSAALTMYTEDPVPAHHSVPDTPHPTTPASILSKEIPGTAAVAGSNLYVYLLARGRDGSQALADLTRRFQQAVNTDPKFPGPANKNGLPILIPDSLKVDGDPGPKTMRALGIVTPTQLKV